MASASIAKQGLRGPWFVVLHAVALMVVIHGVLSIPMHREEHSAFWLFVSVIVPVLGLSAAFARRLHEPMVQSFASRAAVAGALAVLSAWSRFPEAGIVSPIYRTLLTLPFWVALLSAVSGAAAYIFAGRGTLAERFSFEHFIGLRYLKSLRGSALSVVSYIALFGVMLGVALLIVALSILSGFEGDLIDKIMGADAHVSISKHAGYAFEQSEVEQARTVAKEAGASAVAPFIKAEVLLASDANHDWAHLYAVDPKEAARVYAVLRDLREGSLEQLHAQSRGGPRLSPPSEVPADKRVEVEIKNEEGETHTLKLFPPKKPTIAAPLALPGAIIGAKMAKQMHVSVGDTITLVSPLIEELTPRGPAPKTAAYRVAGLFRAQTHEIDAHNIYVAIDDAQRFLELGTDVSGVSMLFDDPLDAEWKSAGMVKAMGGYPFQAVSWESRNRNLFLSLKLEKAVSFLVLLFIVLVASFSIVNTLTMSVIEKAREIAILKTLGARDVSIAKVFFVQGATIGIVGSLAGGLLGCIITICVSEFGIYIDPAVYTVDRLPIRLQWLDVVQVMTLGCVLTSLSSVFPALQGARLSPVEGLRYE